MTSTARKPNLGDQRYLACWCDKNSLEQAARKGGYAPENYEASLLDYADSAEHDYVFVAPNFEAAVTIARSKVTADFWGCPRVYLQEFGPADVPADAREWEDVKFWDIPAEGEPEEQSV